MNQGMAVRSWHTKSECDFNEQSKDCHLESFSVDDLQSLDDHLSDDAARDFSARVMYFRLCPVEGTNIR
jgi:hypothetical protein